jgi:hypothetical protein
LFFVFFKNKSQNQTMPKNDFGNQPIRGRGCQVGYDVKDLEAPNGWRVQPHTKQYPRVLHETREFLHAQDANYVATPIRLIPNLYQKTGLVSKLTKDEKAVRAEELKKEQEEKAKAKQEKKEFNKNKKRPSRAKDAKERLEAEGPDEGCEWSESISRDEVEISWEERHGVVRRCIAPSFKRARWDEDSVPRKGAGRGAGKAPRKAAGICDDFAVVLSRRGLSSEADPTCGAERDDVAYRDDVALTASRVEDDSWTKEHRDIFEELWGVDGMGKEPDMSSFE